MGSSWDNVSFKGESRVKIYELIKIIDYSKITKMKDFRFYGSLQRYGVVWLPIYKDGKQVIKANGKKLNVPFNITNFDPDSETLDKTKECPFVEVSEKICKYIKDDKEKRQYQPQFGYYAQAINRDLQENPDKKGKPSKSEKASGFKESMDSDSFTPVEVHQLNYTIGQNLESIKETNYKKDKKTGEKVFYPCGDDKYGVDVSLKFNANDKGQGKYKVVKGERTPITEEESAFLRWNIKDAIKETTMSRKEAKVEADRILAEFMKSVKGKKSSDDDSPDEDMPDDIEEISSKKSSSKKKAKDDSPDDSPVDSPEENSPLDSPIDSPDNKKSKKNKKKAKDNSPEDSPEDSPEEKKSSGKSSSKKKKKNSPEDSPEDSPEEKKSSKKSSSKKKKDSPEDEDEDEDEDLIDLDDEDDEDEDD